MKGWSGKVLPKVCCNETLEDVEKGITAFPEIHLELNNDNDYYNSVTK